MILLDQSFCMNLPMLIWIDLWMGTGLRIGEYSYDDETETEVPTTTIWTEETTKNEEEDPDSSSNKWVIPTVISVSVVTVVILVVVGVVLYRKYKCFGLWPRRIIKKAQPVLRRLSSAGSLSRASTASSGYSGNRGGVGGRRYKKYLVRLGDRDGVEVEKEIRGRDLSLEFGILKREDSKELSVSVALLPQNLQRNRFSNVLPYDRNRVVLLGNDVAGLEGEDGGREWNDYINASYLSSHSNSKEFICTQAPRQNTVDHFWSMCWESGAEAIVMLTRCYENNKEKCFPYWPSSLIGSSSSRASEIKVHLERMSAYRLDPQNHLWLVSELRIEKGEETRLIIHFAFLSWPDFGVVDPPWALLSFLSHFRKVVARPSPSGKSVGENSSCSAGTTTIVHCSAGVGRTGVFIAVDNIMSQLMSNDVDLERTRSINVFKIVHQMRTERMGMVQTLDQYKLIYNCLSIIGKNKPIPEPIQVPADQIKMSEWGLTEEGTE